MTTTQQSFEAEEIAPGGELHVSFREALDEATPVAFVTPALIALNVIVFLVMLVRGVPFLQPTAHQVLPWGANFGPLTESGQWWRLLTACFLHFGIAHLAVNMYVLYVVGVFTERLFGNLRYGLLYLIAGVCGNLAGLYIHPFAVGAGASGAIFGVYGGLLAFLLIQRGVVPARAAGSIAASAAVFLAYNFVAGLGKSGTDEVAHVGGLVAGFVAGCALAQPLAIGAAHVRALRGLVVTLVFAVAGVVAWRHLPQQAPARVHWYRQLVVGEAVTLPHDDRVVYTGGVTHDQAQGVAQALEHTPILEPPEVAVLLERDRSGTVLSIPLRTDDSVAGQGKEPAGKQAAEANATPLPWNDPSVINFFRLIGPRLAAAAGGPPLVVRLVDGEGEPKRDLDVLFAELTVGKKDRILYTAEVSLSSAQALGAILKAAGIFQDRGSIVIFSRQGGTSNISFLVGESAFQSPAVRVVMEDLARKLRPALGTGPITLHLADVGGRPHLDMVVP